jgi:hypothetical protein
MGDEFFGQYKAKFIEGATEKGYEDPESIWTDISASGSWSFNKSHAVSYGLVSYWTAWAKANHPTEFAVASLNHARSNDHAVKLLRDMVKNEGLEYVPVDPDNSKIGWSVKDGILVGGLTNIKGIGVVKAKNIVAARAGKRAFTPAMYKTLSAPETDFDIIFPAEHYWGFLYKDPMSYGMDTKPVPIVEVEGKGKEFVFLGCLADRNQRDLNEHVFLQRRGGKIETENKLYLNFKLEDDTDIIGCRINRYQYDSMGRDIAENGRLGSDWYLVRGKMTQNWRIIDVIEIVNLNKYFKVDIK